LITAAGVSRAINVALHLAAKLTIETKAKQVQIFIEYDRQPPFGSINWSNLSGESCGRPK
jgi:hypothetical protein